MKASWQLQVLLIKADNNLLNDWEAMQYCTTEKFLFKKNSTYYCNTAKSLPSSWTKRKAPKAPTEYGVGT